jgi:putative transposase
VHVRFGEERPGNSFDYARSLTPLPTDEGWLYLALVLDLFSRKLVGWAMSETMPQELTLAALAVALGWRDPAPGLVHHSDRGSQYAAGDYRKVLRARGITVSMSRKGDCWDAARRPNLT